VHFAKWVGSQHSPAQIFAGCSPQAQKSGLSSFGEAASKPAKCRVLTAEVIPSGPEAVIEV
jgi:hypothetical protein